jgi:ketosteroid isomerase-like protein
MAPGPHEQILDTLSDLDARLAGLQVGYSEPNATAAQEHVAELAEFFESEPEAFVALRGSVERLVDTEDSTHAAEAKEHADELKRQIQAQVDQE